MLLLAVVLFLILAILTGVLGILIKGAFWLFIFTVVFLVIAYFAGKRSRT